MNDISNLNSSSFKITSGEISLKYFGNDESHSQKYLDWMNDPEIVSTIGRFEYLMPVTQQDLVDYVNNVDRKNTMFLSINFQDDFIGTLKVYAINQLYRSAGIGIAIGDKNYWGKGIASEVIKIIKEYLFETMGLERLHAGYYETNKGMEKAFLKNGFEIEGTLRKHIYTGGRFIDHKLVGCLKEKR